VAHHGHTVSSIEDETSGMKLPHPGTDCLQEEPSADMDSGMAYLSSGGEPDQPT
jgi:hypothetical protein